MPSTHVPLFIHGLLWHSSISETKTYNCHASFKLILKCVTGNCLCIIARTVTDRRDDDDDDDDDDDALFVLS